MAIREAATEARKSADDFSVYGVVVKIISACLVPWVLQVASQSSGGCPPCVAAEFDVFSELKIVLHVSRFL